MKLLFIQEYHVDLLSGAVGEIVIRPVEDRILLSLADTAGSTADIALLYYCAPQDVFIPGELFREPIPFFEEGLQTSAFILHNRNITLYFGKSREKNAPK